MFQVEGSSGPCSNLTGFCGHGEELPVGPSVLVDAYMGLPPSYKLVYNPINYRYITYKP